MEHFVKQRAVCIIPLAPSQANDTLRGKRLIKNNIREIGMSYTPAIIVILITFVYDVKRWLKGSIMPNLSGYSQPHQFKLVRVQMAKHSCSSGSGRPQRSLDNSQEPRWLLSALKPLQRKRTEEEPGTVVPDKLLSLFEKEERECEVTIGRKRRRRPTDNRLPTNGNKIEVVAASLLGD
ncbi:hypothetical protein ACROYT_G015565 [Oculina patagonica]